MFRFFIVTNVLFIKSREPPKRSQYGPAERNGKVAGDEEFEWKKPTLYSQVRSKSGLKNMSGELRAFFCMGLDLIRQAIFKRI